MQIIFASVKPEDEAYYMGVTVDSQHVLPHKTVEMDDDGPETLVTTCKHDQAHCVGLRIYATDEVPEGNYSSTIVYGASSVRCCSVGGPGFHLAPQQGQGGGGGGGGLDRRVLQPPKLSDVFVCLKRILAAPLPSKTIVDLSVLT